MNRIVPVALALLPALLAASAFAQNVAVRASVDRTTLKENESFTYVLRAEGQVRGEPDIAPLEQQFELLQSTTSTRLQIVNGQASQVAEWIYQLMPNEVGPVTIPAIEIAGTFSNPVELEVLPATAASSDAPGEIFLEVEALPTRAYAQSQVVYTLRLFVAPSTGRATISPPEILGGEAIVERLGEDRQYQTSRGGLDFRVRERRYAIFPQQAGTITIGPATFEAMVIPSRGFSRVQRFRSEPLELTVLPAVPPPAAHPGAAWLPASEVTLSERWTDPPAELSVGVPTTRALTVEARGLLETQLPKIALPQASGVRQYEDQPELNRTVTPEGLIARRIERYAVLAQTAGDVDLPAVSLPWFDVDEGEWKVAELPSRRVTVAPSGEVPAALADPAPAPAPAPPPQVVSVDSGYWPAVALLLGAAWAATLLAWWRSSAVETRAAAPRSRMALPRRPANRRLLKELRTACARDDAEQARRALLEWGEIRFPESAPRTLGALAERVPERLAAAVRELESRVYGPGLAGWSGADLAAALDDLDAVTGPRGAAPGNDTLLPLYR